MHHFAFGNKLVLLLACFHGANTGRLLLQFLQL